MTTQNEINLENKNRIYEIIKTTFNKDRSTKLIKMYDEYGDQLLNAPASGKEHYHNAFCGGYAAHILNVYDNAISQANMFSKALKKQGLLPDFTKVELTMAALHHDLWKLGLPNEPYYVLETSDWHQKRGSKFTHNEKLPYMQVTDGALFILQLHKIPLTLNETLAIKLSDGLYDESNKSYLMGYGKYPLHSSLPHIIHWADHMSATLEREELKQEFLTT